MATWVKGIDFKNSDNTSITAGVGVFGTDTVTNKLYMGLGANPWDNAGLQVTSSSIDFKGNKIYHAGDRPTVSEIGAAPASHNHTSLTGVTTIGGGGATGTYGSLTISGAKNSWAGIHFSNAGDTSLMVDSNGLFGVHTVGSGWKWSFDGSGNLTVGTVPWARLSGVPSTFAPSAPHANSISGSNNTGVSTANDASKIWKSGFYETSNGTNYPSTGSWYWLIHAGHSSNNNGGSYQYGMQLAGQNGTNNFFIRTTNNVGTGTWNQLYHTNNKPTPSDIGAAESSHNHTSLTGVTSIGGAGASSSWGSVNISGAKGGWAGVHFSDFGYVWMVRNDGYTGMWKNGGNPVFAFDNNGALATGSVGWDKITSKPSTYAPSSHDHSRLVGINDTRSTNYTPATERTEFKVTFQGNGTNSVSDGGSWYTLMHIPRYPDSSGGYGSQIALTDNENLWYRKGTSDSAWGNWRRIWHSGNFDPSSKSDSSHNHDGVYMKQISANGFYGMTANGDASNWVRTTVNGIIPYASGGASSLGTSSWPFSEVYANNIYDNGVLLENKFAPASHSHSYLPLSGGSLSGALTLANNTWNNVGDDALIGDCNQAGMIGIKGSNGNTGIYLASYSGSTAQTITTNGSGTLTISGTTTGTFSGSLAGNASTATTLQNSRTINGTSFNGSANIVTSSWGTARTLTIGNTGKSVDGSGAVNWTLAEIGAAEASHTHAYLPLSGGSMRGEITSYYSVNLINSGQLMFGIDGGTAITQTCTLSTDSYGGFKFYTGEGLEAIISRRGRLNGFVGFDNSFDIETSTSPSITFYPNTNTTSDTGGRLIFKSTDNQNVQLRHEWYDAALMPFGLIIEKASGNTQNYNAALKVEGAIICGCNASSGNIDNTNKADARLVRGATDSSGSVKLQLGGTNTTASFEVVNPNWTTAWFSCGNTGIRATSYSNFSDKTLKTNIKEFNDSIVDKMNNIKVYNYNYKSDYDDEITTYSGEAVLLENMPEQRWGVIAQEIEEIFPELITESVVLIDGENKKVKSVDVYGLTVLTLEYAKELKAEIESIKQAIGI